MIEPHCTMNVLLRSTTLLLLLLAILVGATGGHHRHHHHHHHRHLHPHPHPHPRPRPRPTSQHNSTDFIISSCRTTLYPALCFSTLSTYAPTLHRSPRQLAQVALTVSVNRTHAASVFIAHLTSGPQPARSRERGAVRDCLETLGDSVDELRTSVTELRKMGPKGSERFEWHLSNAQTWVSAALTDQNTCLDSLAEDRHAAGVRAAIRSRIVMVARVTSIALALVNRLGDMK